MPKIRRTMRKIITLLLLIAMSNNLLLAQKDSININTSTDTTFSQYDKMFQYFIADKTEVKQLYKMDIFQLALQRPNFSYERKLSKNTSIEVGGLVSLKSWYNEAYYDVSAVSDFSLSEKIFYLRLNTDYKYYHNIKKRTLKGKNTNGFSANYFSVGLAAHLFFYNNNYYYTSNDGFIRPNYPGYIDNTEHMSIRGTIREHEPRESTGCVRFGYGLQRRIGNIGYASAELKLGVGTNKNFDRLWILPELNVKVGFAIKSFRKR